MNDTSNSFPPPPWRLPPGVTRGLWDYVHSPPVATDFDEYFAFNRLFEFDEQLLAQHFQKPGLVADLGCGTGRALVPLVRRGFTGLAIDLSEHMLQVVRQKALAERLPIDCVLANMVDLDFLSNDSIDYAICMFSTLGMIRGRENRQQSLDHIRRALKPGGLFVLHVHNYWYNLLDPGGPWWAIGSYLRAKTLGDIEPGDKWFDYRGVHNMFLHVFTQGELKGALKAAGFRIKEFVLLHPTRRRPISAPWLLGRLRANGWIVVCE